MSKAGVVAALLFVSAPARAEPEASFATPPPSLIEQLRSQPQSHGWLRVSMGTTRFDLRARQIDEEGLSGLKARGSDRRRLQAYISAPASRGHIAWSSISRIDQYSLSRGGRIAGFVAGGIAGAAAASGQPFLGGVIGGFSGAWVGGKIGDRFVRTHPLYVARVLATPPAIAVAAPIETTPLPSDSITAGSLTLDPSREVVRACRALKPVNLLRIDADFGRFQGYATQVGPEGLAGLRADLVADRSNPPPTGLVTWDRIDRLEKRGGSAGRGAIMGALFVGTAGFALGTLVILIVAASGAEVDAASTVEVIGTGTLAGGALGAGIGGLIAAPVQGWHMVYQRPRRKGDSHR